MNEGNQYHLALKDPDVRKRAYKSFCDHLAKGKAIKSWSFKEENHLCCWATMLSYLKNESEFDPIYRKIAESEGYAHWESIVEQSAAGKNKEANTASLQMLMRNKFGWDKDTSKSSNTSYTIKVDRDGIATGVSTETLSATDNTSAE